MKMSLFFQIGLLCFMVVMSGVVCGRVPLGIIRAYSNEVDAKTIENLSEEYLFDPESDASDTGVITDVQIDEIRNTQDKISQDQEIYHIDPRCPAFSGICTAPTCSSDRDCGGRVCCYNGCVHTCTEDNSPPIAVDWVPLGEEKLTLLSDHTKGTITIPGGCRVTLKQRKSLDLFLKYGHVTMCACQRDDVVCYVRNRYPSNLSSEDISPGAFSTANASV